jgi:hypothetical protein
LPYRLIITPAVEAQLLNLPRALERFAREQLALLGQDPVGLSKPAPLLYRRGQLFEAHYARGGVYVWVSIIFRYGQDEESIHIEDVTIEFG